MNTTLFLVALYFVGLFVISRHITKRETGRDFINASQQLDWFSFGLSNFAAMFSGYNVIVGIMLAILLGPWSLAWLLGFVGAYLFFYVLYTNHLGDDRSALLSVPDYYSAQYGSMSKWVTQAFYAILLLLLLGILLFTNASIVTAFVPLSATAATLLVAIVVLAYTLWGGFKTVVGTDVFQGGLTLVFLALFFTGDFSAITVSALTNDLTTRSLVIAGIAMAILQFLVTSADPTFWQRIFAVRSAQDCRWGLIFSLLLTGLIALPLTLLGLAARYSGVDPATASPVELLSAASPLWLIPVLAVAIFAALMSTIDSYLFAFASQVASLGSRTKDKDGDSALILRIRLAMPVAMVIAVVLALITTGFLQFALSIASISAVVTPVLLSSWILRVDSDGEIARSGIFAIVAFFGFWMAGMLTEDITTTLYPSATAVVFVVVQRVVLFVTKSRAVVSG